MFADFRRLTLEGLSNIPSMLKDTMVCCYIFVLKYNSYFILYMRMFVQLQLIICANKRYNALASLQYL